MTKNILALTLVGVFALTGVVAYYVDSLQSNQTNVAEEQPVKQTKSQAHESQAHQNVGRTAYIDPTSGELVSEPAQVIQPGSVTIGAEDLPPVKITTHSNGMVQADLNGRFQIPLQATIGCDGQITKEHSNREILEATNCETKK